LAEVPPAKAIGNQIQQVLLNLLTNARQSMSDGGRIVISLSHDAVNDTVDLAIRDTGSGIPADKLPHIFDPFFSTKAGPDSSGKGGAGLGLATCRDIVERHHGRIRVESKVGVGTAFIIRLPVYRPRAESPAPPVATPATGTLPSSQHV
jgi:signal transduction histidine kinase